MNTPGARPASNYRWIVCGLLFFATTINYIDRQILNLLVGPIRRAASDAELANGLGTGEAWAVTEAWHRFAPMVLMTADRALGSSTEAEDLAQEVFWRVFRRAKTLRDPGSLRSFVYSVAL